MSNCASGCKSQNHSSYAECLRASMPAVRNSSQSKDRLYSINAGNDRDITEYKKAHEQGIRPAGSKVSDVREAVAASRAADTALTLRN